MHQSIEQRIQLPLLQQVRKSYPFANLEDAYVICAQHLLETSVTLFYNLFEMGLETCNLSVIGKCYSTNPSVYYDLKNIKGLDVCPTSQKFCPRQSFDNQYKKNMVRFLETRLKKILASGCRKLIIVDDGGELIHLINQGAKAKLFAAGMQIIGIEQTSSGFTKLQKLSIGFPVINVARSDVKLHLEASLIADAIIKSIWAALDMIDLRPTKAFIFGNGVIGSKVQERLIPYYEIDSYDPMSNRSSIQEFESINFNQYNMIIGCSGSEVLNSSNFHLLAPETALISGSSSDREFCSVKLRRQIDHIADCHEHIHVNGIYLINCGFPVNFSDNYNLVDDDRYQLTRALLLAGILQGSFQQDLSPGFIELNMDIQNMISQQFLLLYPDFEETMASMH